MFKEIAPNIVIDNEVRFGESVVKGTRITVEEVLGALAGGMDFEEINREYGLAKRDILAVLNYTACFLKGIRPKIFKEANYEIFSRC